MELGNALFGHARGAYPVPREETWEALLQSLFKAVHGPQATSYGQQFLSPRFDIRPYYWGDCTCGFEEAESAWLADHPCPPSCFASLYNAEASRIGYGHPQYHEHLTRWARAHGFPQAPDGMAMHCDCGRRLADREWLARHHHTSVCPIILPNFAHHPSGFSLMWYKYPLRDSYMNQSLSYPQFHAIIDDCLRWIQQHRPSRTGTSIVS